MEAVCAAAADASAAHPPEIEVLDGVTSLLDKNLLVRREDADEAPRFGMLETIHEYARERLEESGEAALLRRRHAQFFLALAESAEPRLQGSEQAHWLRRLDEEHDNFRGALRSMLEHGEATSLLRMSAALAPFWYLRSYRSEGRRWLCEALRAESGELLMERAHALYGAARLVWEQDSEAARALTEECLVIYRKLSETGRIGRALNLLGNFAKQQGDLEQAEPLYRESLLLQRKVGDPNGIAVALCNLGTIAQERQEYDRAVTLYEESVDLARRHGNRVLTGVLIGNLASVATLQDDLPRTAALYREGLQVHRDVGYRYGIAWMLGNLAGVAGAEGSPLRAARLFGAAEAIFTTLGTHLEPVARSHYDRELAAARAPLADAAWQRGCAEGAAMSLDDAIECALQE